MAHMTQMKKLRCNVTCTYIIQCNTLVYTMCTTRSHKEEYSFIPLACAECDNSLPLSGDSSIPLCYILFPSTLFHYLVFHSPSLHPTIYFLVYLSASLLPKSYTGSASESGDLAMTFFYF